MRRSGQSIEEYVLQQTIQISKDFVKIVTPLSESAMLQGLSRIEMWHENTFLQLMRNFNNVTNLFRLQRNWSHFHSPFVRLFTLL